MQENTAVAEEVAPKPEPAYCRWCGALGDAEAVAEQPTDWLCASCDRYQDATTCPTCGGNARVSALPAEMQPKPAKPVKTKGD